MLIFLFPTENGVSTGAALLGIGAGFTLERRWVGFETRGLWWQRTLRFIVGAAVMVGLWLGLKMAFSSLEPAFLFRFIRYGLMGLWGALGAPWVFVRLGWAETGSAQKSAQPLVFTQDKAQNNIV